MMQNELRGMRVFAWLGVMAGAVLGLARADEMVDHSISVGGKDRTYHVHKDKTPTTPVPLVVVLHGGGGNGRILKDTYGFQPMIAAGELIAVYPDALAGGWVPDDVAFVDAVIDEVFAREKVDRERLFVTGASRGGLLTFVMAAKSKHALRAAGSVIASHLQGLADEFPIARPIDFAMIAGTADPLMPYEGGFNKTTAGESAGDPKARVLPVEETMGLFLKANSITGAPVVSTLGDKDPHDGCTNEVRRWSNPATGRRVMLVKVEGGGHVVPGGRQYLPKSVIGPACSDFHHAEVMWQFFKTAGASSAAPATAPAGVATQPKLPRADHGTEQALRARVTALFATTRAGDIAKCIQMSDPTIVQRTGRDKAEQFFKAISGLVRLSRVGSDDHRIATATIAPDGKWARVQTQIRLGGKWQPPGIEVWRLVDGTWCYQETVKDERRWQVN